MDDMYNLILYRFAKIRVTLCMGFAQFLFVNVTPHFADVALLTYTKAEEIYKARILQLYTICGPCTS